ncbi:MAG: sugar ABC transporter ATP-binding protein [Planctomycetota bacterium]|jgi:ribose transport system ATP-binding protein|nr:sugar ABC transporter ATP-binding protein [Planctomycetota bacterium]
MSEFILEMRNITKLYPGVKALDNVTLQFRPGEVHALVGENGAGKSTLIKTASGAIEPTAGSIVVGGTAHPMLTPATSGENGIAVVYQEFTLVPVMTAAENIFLGKFIRHGWFCDFREMNRRAASLFKRLNIDIDPEAQISTLTTGYQQIVEIAKAVASNPRILIMDEPSAPLTTNEVDSMLEIVRMLRREGVAIIYITHRLDEIFQIADRVSVLRDGQYITTKNIADTNKEDLIRLMVGRTLKETYPERKPSGGEVVLELDNVTGNGVKNISFALRKGEILGLGGLVGAGRTELAALIFGNAEIRSGGIRLHGRPLRPRTPGEAIAKGISLVPEDRKAQGLILNMSIKDNITVASVKKLSRRTFLDKRSEESFTQTQIDNLNIKTPSSRQLARNLSGGNQQKVVLGKWLGTDPEILIFDEPTRGIDVGAKQEIYKLMSAIAESGKSIIMISSEMEELLGMSDRVVVLSKGRVTGTLDRKDFSQERVMQYAVEGHDVAH